MRLGALRAGLELLNEARGARRGRQLLRSRARGGLLRARRLPLPAEQRPDVARPAQRGARARRALGHAVRLSFARTSFRGARAAGAASATTRPRARTSSARCSSRRTRTIRARSAPRTSRRRSSPTARGTGCSRAATPRRRATAYEELADRVLRRPAHEQPRRPELPPRQDRRGDRRCSRRRSRIALETRPRRRRRAGRVLARADPPAHRQHRPGRGAGAACARAARAAGNEDYLDEIGNAQLVLGRALLEQDRLDEAEAAFAAAEASFGQLGSAEPSRGGVGRPRRPRGAAR